LTISEEALDFWRLFPGPPLPARGAALTGRLQAFETDMLAEEENFAELARLDRR